MVNIIAWGYGENEGRPARKRLRLWFKDNPTLQPLVIADFTDKHIRSMHQVQVKVQVQVQVRVTFHLSLLIQQI